MPVTGSPTSNRPTSPSLPPDPHPTTPITTLDPLPFELRDQIFTHLTSTDSLSTLLSVIRLSRSHYAKHIHQLYYRVHLDKANLSSFFSGIVSGKDELPPHDPAYPWGTVSRDRVPKTLPDFKEDWVDPPVTWGPERTPLSQRLKLLRMVRELWVEDIVEAGAQLVYTQVNLEGFKPPYHSRVVLAPARPPFE
ncbi:hypothetical protein IAT38_005382 [Cryptococcus sp. DSM 104549]